MVETASELVTKTMISQLSPQVKKVLGAARPSASRRSLARFVRILRAQLPELSRTYRVKSLGVFGSYARREEKRQSDLDLVVEFSPPTYFDARFEMADSLSELLGVKVETIPQENLPPHIRKRVMREVIWLQKDGVVLPVKLPRRKTASRNAKRNGGNMEPKREYLDYLQDILDNMARVRRFVEGMTMEEMAGDDKTDFAVRYALQTVGEAANRIPREIQKMYPDIPWKEMIGMRNAMAHGYDRMIYAEIWKAIHESIPRVQPRVAEMLEAEKKRRGIDDETKKQEPTD